MTTYGTDALHLAMPYVRDFGVAIDGGANLGSWSAELVSRFDCVHAYEPQLCLAESLVVAQPEVVVHQSALWHKQCRCKMSLDGKRTKASSRYAAESDDGDVVAITIDSENLQHVGLVKLDLEGGEFFALQGGERTIRRWRPVVVIESNRHFGFARYGIRPQAAESLLSSWGAVELGRMGEDVVFAFTKDVP